jgi:formate dehydrogenase subunit gamma
MSDEMVVRDRRLLLRYTFRERLMHWTAAITYVYLLLTGLAFWSPWLFWLAIVLGGGNGSNSRELHPWVGLIFSLVMVWMVLVWRDQMHATDADRAWRRELRHYIRNEDDLLPPEGRFNAGQKSFFWIFLWATLALLLSGLVLWFTDSIPWSLRWLRYLSVLVHAVAALVTIALFMIHVYMGTAVEREAFASMTRGYVTRAWARRFHRLWHDEVAGGSATKK